MDGSNDDRDKESSGSGQKEDKDVQGERSGLDGVIREEKNSRELQ